MLEGKYLIQCKRYSNPVGVSILRDLYGTVHSENANKGILITTASFTSIAKTFAEGKQIELIDGNKLKSLLEEYKLSQVEGRSGRPSESFIVYMNSFIKPLKNIIARMDDLKNNKIFLNKKPVNE